MRDDDSDDLNDVRIADDDIAFVNQLTESQLAFFTSRMNPKEFKTAKELDGGNDVEEEDDDDEDEEEEKQEKNKKVDIDRMREAPVSWLKEQERQELLPIRKEDGTVVLPEVTKEDLKDREQLEKQKEQREQEKLEHKKISKKKRKLEDEEFGSKPGSKKVEKKDEKGGEDSSNEKEEEKERFDVTDLKAFQEKLDHIPNKKKEIQSACVAILANPEENLATNIVVLLGLCADDDAVIKQLAILSCGAVFADLIPSYRIREGNEEKQDGVKLSKDIKKLRHYERILLHHYKQFVDLMEFLLGLKAPNPATEEELKLYESGKKMKKIHVKTEHVLHQLQNVGTKALSKVFLTNPSFNFGDRVLKFIVRSANHKNAAVASAAVATIAGLFEQKAELEQILGAVLEIGRLVKEKKFVVNAALVRTFLKLDISDNIVDIDIKNVNERKVRKEKVFVNKKEKKARKFGKMVEAKVKAGEAERRKAEVQRFQKQMAQSMFLTYFRVLKTAQNSPLLPVVLEGIARWCHLLNIEFMYEIVQALLKLLQSASLPLISAFYCSITAFQALKNSGDVFRIDLSAYYHFVYPRLLQIPFSEDISEAESVYGVAVRCLQLMLSSKSYRMSVRSAAFAKRLGTLSIHAPANGALAMLQFCRQIISTDYRLDQLIDPEDAGTADVFSPLVDDPDNCNPFSTSLFELLLLQEHYHPHVALFASQTLKNEELAPHDPTDYLYSYSWNTQIFNPPLEEPGPSRFDKKLKKLEKYSEAKKRKFAQSLMTEKPQEDSSLTKDSVRKAKLWLYRGNLAEANKVH